jgi:lipid-binding SYLF domain-containing protein
MHRSLALAIVAAALAGCASTTPAPVQSAAPTSGEVTSAQQLVNGAAATVEQMKADPRYAALLRSARGVFVAPNVVRGAFVIGGTGARGVLLRHEASGTWSNPAFLTIGSVSIGAQAGGTAGPAVLFLMTERALTEFTEANNFSLGANAGLTVVNYSAQRRAPIGTGDIVVWSAPSGVFAGASVNGADVTQNTAEDGAYYGRPVTARQILDGLVTNPGTATLRSALSA